MDGICVIRNTFRVDDNILLFKALQNKVNTIYIPIVTRRVLKPTDCVPVVNPSAHTIQNKHYIKYNSGNYYWGYHQYYFLLQAIRSFEEDLRLRFSHINVVVQKQSVSRHISFIKAFGTCYCDRVDDPAWFSFDKALGTQYDKTRLHLYPTQTLLDWQDTEHHSFLAQWSHKRQNQSFKEYVFSQSFDFHTQIHQNECNTTFLNPLQKQTHTKQPPHTSQHSPTITQLHSRKQVHASSKKETSTSGKGAAQSLQSATETHTKRRTRNTTEWNLHTEINTWKDIMLKHRVVPFDIPPNTTCEQWALDMLTDCSKEMSSTNWEKPKTQSTLSIREHSITPHRTTSRLSPFFALGILSPRVAYVRWQGKTVAQHKSNAKRPSSAVAQLLWREEFHACSLLEGFWDTRKNKADHHFWKRDREWTTAATDTGFQELLQAHATKTVKGTPVSVEDTNTSVMMLVQDGWIHHLRRHVIADYITRGYLQADWMLGEALFRQCLLDHDASVNRGNWLWLSACDFSTAQLVRHYNHNDYIRRQSTATATATAIPRMDKIRLHGTRKERV
jgi:deoxyribodipyrimidine photolyase